jgi:CRISPR/Cas system-associated endonuclease Cas3-HD
MVNLEILEGLKTAMLRGDTLKEAMISFYNSGYKKEEIEEAARNLNLEEIKKEFQLIEQEKKGEQLILEKTSEKKKEISNKSTNTPIAQSKVISELPKKYPKNITSTSQINLPQEIKDGKTKQVVSSYGKKSNLAVILLVVILFILIGALVLLFLFKDRIIELF